MDDKSLKDDSRDQLVMTALVFKRHMMRNPSWVNTAMFRNWIKQHREQIIEWNRQPTFGSSLEHQVYGYGTGCFTLELPKLRKDWW